MWSFGEVSISTILEQFKWSVEAVLIWHAEFGSTSHKAAKQPDCIKLMSLQRSHIGSPFVNGLTIGVGRCNCAMPGAITQVQLHSRNVRSTKHIAVLQWEDLCMTATKKAFHVAQTVKAA